MPDSPVEELSDVSYDGRRMYGTLTGGLGRLIDGETGADNYRLDIGYGKGEELMKHQSFLEVFRIPID